MTKRLPEYLAAKGRRTSVSWGRKRRKEILTMGAIPLDGEGFVYVGTSETGRIKVGMTSDPPGRANALGIEMRFLMPVVPAAAKEVETLTLQLLGHDQGDGEWLKSMDLLAVEQAVSTAMSILRRRIWVDPQLTEDDARKARIRLLANESEQQEILQFADRKNRRVSIVSHRRAFGVRAAVGSRFG